MHHFFTKINSPTPIMQIPKQTFQKNVSNQQLVKIPTPKARIAVPRI